jgi:uncharacterized protein (DUF433 family)
MPQVEELLPQIELLDPVEREQVLASLLKSMGPEYQSAAGSKSVGGPLQTPAVVSTPGVCGGSARLIRTRIPVWLLERMRQLGLSEQQILQSYPTLRAIDLVQAWSYIESHREEIESAIAENEQPGE